MRGGGLKMFIDDESSPGVGPYAGCVQVEAVGHRSASGGKQQCVSFPKIGGIVGIVRIGQCYAIGSVVYGQGIGVQTYLDAFPFQRFQHGFRNVPVGFGHKAAARFQ